MSFSSSGSIRLVPASPAIGHTNPALTFQVYEQVATRRYIDEQAVWNVMRFADEPEDRTPSRQLTRTANGPRNGPLAENSDRHDLPDDRHSA